MSNRNIPQYEPLIGWYEKQAMSEYMENPGFLTEYKKTQDLEVAISSFLGVKHCILVNNGTLSLSLALLALGVKPGDNVLVPDITMVATPNAVKLIGANPIFVDVDGRGLLDFSKADSLVDVYKPKAIIFVSLNGRSFEGPSWEYIWKWKDKGIRLLEDAAQAFGSKTYEEVFCGTRGFEVASFSFSMPKIITTGQGGCLVTDDSELASTLRKLKDFGRSGGGNDIHSTFGINCKFTEMQAVVGLAQLGDIDYRIRRKKQMFQLYKTKLQSLSSSLKFIPTDLSVTTPWFVDVFVNSPTMLMSHLKSKGIGTRLIYPPIHKQQVYSAINDWSFPNAERFSKGLWLPSSFTLRDEDIEYVCDSIREFYAG